MYKFLFFFISFSLSAQIRGVVKDSISGEPIPYVNIWVENETIGTTSETNGSFSLDIKEEKLLVFSALGYEIKKASSKSEVILLKPKVVELKEVVISIPKKSKELEIGVSKKRYYLPESQVEPWIIAKKFDVDENNQDVNFVKDINFFIKSEIQKGVFRVRFFEVNSDGMPGEDLVSEEIIVEVKKGKSKITVDVSKYNIQIPKEGIVVGFESLFINRNKYNQKASLNGTKKTIYIVNYGPHIEYCMDSNETSYVFRSSRWIKQTRTKYNEKETRSFAPAITLTLTN
ncbi:MAG: carboxypeptidase-like regulatory domain-containing protein [Flavobacterium sp.]|nr:carboxypeptidase-like regulatory domain-containing protein [Flavobacterium sp.]MDP5096723.1 carboxypeptidase-like regulatory domain-containing protein [Flavobacterium sp.]